jgi:hypothetical protein
LQCAKPDLAQTAGWPIAGCPAKRKAPRSPALARAQPCRPLGIELKQRKNQKFFCFFFFQKKKILLFLKKKKQKDF